MWCDRFKGRLGKGDALKLGQLVELGQEFSPERGFGQLGFRLLLKFGVTAGRFGGVQRGDLGRNNPAADNFFKEVALRLAEPFLEAAQLVHRQGGLLALNHIVPVAAPGGRRELSGTVRSA